MYMLYSRYLCNLSPFPNWWMQKHKHKRWAIKKHIHITHTQNTKVIGIDNINRFGSIVIYTMNSFMEKQNQPYFFYYSTIWLKNLFKNQHKKEKEKMLVSSIHEWDSIHAFKGSNWPKFGTKQSIIKAPNLMYSVFFSFRSKINKEWDTQEFHLEYMHTILHNLMTQKWNFDNLS